MKKLFSMLLTFLKIGLFTFGGGYAMVAIIENELVEKKKWITHEDFLDIIAIAESTPGPIAVNTATFIGYKLSGVLGSVFCTLGVVLPAFCVIFVISFFYEQFLALEYIGYAFKGIQVGVVFLIFTAGLKMLLKMKKNPVSVCLVILICALMITLDLLAKNISSIYYVLIGGGMSLIVYAIINAKRKLRKKNQDDATPKKEME